MVAGTRGIRWAARVAVLLITLTTLGVCHFPASASPSVAFSPRYTANANGAIIVLGNNLLTCPTSANNCAKATAGSTYDNNDFVMDDLDADNDASTRNSSMSRLALPDGATVLWAGLY